MKRTHFFESVYLHKIVYYIGFGVAALYVLSFFSPPLFTLASLVLLFLAVFILLDAVLLYAKKSGVVSQRSLADRLSNGDANTINISVENNYHFKIECTIIDELPVQFQERKWRRVLFIQSETTAVLPYTITPVERGIYDFGNINVYVSSPLKIVRRKFVFSAAREVKVYPSYLQMRRYQLIAVGNHLAQNGTKRIRKLGHSMEFEQIKEYVRGDDYRTINWKATARNGGLMVNNYTDERSQQIFCVINKGRVMKMPFHGMTLLDYAINASLVICNTALLKQDKAGLVTYSDHVDTFLLPDKKPGQLSMIQETLYREKTSFSEPDNEKLFSVIRNRITQRSLLVLFTNFESMESLERDLPFLKRMAHYHLLMVVFFQNTELKALMETKAKTTEDIYIKTIAEKYDNEKRRMVKELQKQGIIAILTTPQQLTINTLNKYLELKDRQSI